MTPSLDALSEHAIRHVLEAGVRGELPSFAATLGAGPSAFEPIRAALGLPKPPENWVYAEPAHPWAQVQALLWRWRQGHSVLTWATAGAVACASWGRGHLWQDLGLRGRHDVTALLTGHFPGLVARNTRDLKWKHFLYAEVGAALGEPDLRAPHCAQCDSFASCYPAAAAA